MKIKEIIENEIKAKTNLNFSFRLLTSGFRRYPDIDAEEISDWQTPVVYSKEFDAIGLILSPKKIIDTIMRVPATSHRLFVETGGSLTLTSYYQEEGK